MIYKKFPKNFKIEKFHIGKKSPVFVIAEIGINHNGSYSLAKKMVNFAKKTGVQCVKFQTHITEKEMIKTTIRPGSISKKSLWDIIKSCELSELEEERIQNYCKKEKILFLSTPFSKDAVTRLEKLNLPAYKIGSGELTNMPLIQYVAEKKKPIILSTGMSTMSEIKRTVNFLRQYKIPLAILQTTSTYPSKFEEIQLGLIQEYEKIFQVPVGLSDHTTSIYTSLGAVAKGACIIEKHFTIDKKLPGPDQKISLDPKEFSELVIGCNAIHLALGNKKTILKNEKPILKFARECVVSVKNIEKNEQLTTKNISTKRPATGTIPATDYFKMIGKTAKRKIPSDKQLSWSDII